MFGFLSGVQRRIMFPVSHPARCSGHSVAQQSDVHVLPSESYNFLQSTLGKGLLLWLKIDLLESKILSALFMDHRVVQLNFRECKKDKGRFHEQKQTSLDRCLYFIPIKVSFFHLHHVVRDGNQKPVLNCVISCKMHITCKMFLATRKPVSTNSTLMLKTCISNQ